MEAEIRWGLATLIAVGVFFIPTFLVNLFYAPAKISNEQKRETDKLQGELASTKANTAIANHLAIKYNELVTLMAEKVTSAKQFTDWKKRKSAWWGSTSEYIMENVSTSQGVLFSSVSNVSSSRETVTFGNQYNEEHCAELISLVTLREKLEKLMTEYDKSIKPSVLGKEGSQT